MLASHPIIAFIATTDPARARGFYEDTLGLRLVSVDSFALVFNAGNTMLRVVTVGALQPAGFTVLGWIVPDIRAAVRDLEALSVEFLKYPGLEQDSLGIWASPNGARVAWFGDPDGNVLSLTQLQAT